jgi:hypothetical protein
MAIPFNSPTFTAHNVHRLLLETSPLARPTWVRDNDARIRSLRIEIDELIFPIPTWVN